MIISMIINYIRSFFGSMPHPEKMPLDCFLAEEIIDSPYIKHNLKSSISKRAQAAGFKKFSLNNNDLTDVGLKIGAKKSLEAIRHRSRHRVQMMRDVRRISDAGFSCFSFVASNDERDCEWCKSTNGEYFPIDADINLLIKKNCTCEYCRCCIKAIRHSK